MKKKKKDKKKGREKERQTAVRPYYAFQEEKEIRGKLLLLYI